jgi:ubiquinone biosynthesis protein UbiJ
VTAPSDPSTSLHLAAIAVLEEVSNRLLRLDVETRRRLGDIQDHVILLEVEGRGAETATHLYCFPSEGGFRFRTDYDGKPDVVLRGNPGGYYRLLRGERGSAFREGRMQISGDLELGQRLQRILKGIDIDWEEAASRYVGDSLAHQLGNAARAFGRWGRHVRKTVEDDIAETMQEELRLTPRREQVERFLDDVDRLRSDVDRITKRVERLKGASS